ncbi:MAG TPA: cobyrinic acid a,c-diamide synthase, partial [Nitrospirota bacterium]|nr:cobyrinic acid a,c-diamide synthase [Nitrospirota bacterium]
LPETVFGMRRGIGIDGKADGLVYKNIVASYTHLHALGTPEWAPGLVNTAREYRTGKRQGRG